MSSEKDSIFENFSLDLRNNLKKNPLLQSVFFFIKYLSNDVSDFSNFLLGGAIDNMYNEYIKKIKTMKNDFGEEKHLPPLKKNNFVDIFKNKDKIDPNLKISELENLTMFETNFSEKSKEKNFSSEEASFYFNLIVQLKIGKTIRYISFEELEEKTLQKIEENHLNQILGKMVKFIGNFSQKENFENDKKKENLFTIAKKSNIELVENINFCLKELSNKKKLNLFTFYKLLNKNDPVHGVLFILFLSSFFKISVGVNHLFSIGCFSPFAGLETNFKQTRETIKEIKNNIENIFKNASKTNITNLNSKLFSLFFNEEDKYSGKLHFDLIYKIRASNKPELSFFSILKKNTNLLVPFLVANNNDKSIFLIFVNYNFLSMISDKPYFLNPWLARVHLFKVKRDKNETDKSYEEVIYSTNILTALALLQIKEVKDTDREFFINNNVNSFLKDFKEEVSQGLNPKLEPLQMLKLLRIYNKTLQDQSSVFLRINITDNKDEESFSIGYGNKNEKTGTVKLDIGKENSDLFFRNLDIILENLSIELENDRTYKQLSKKN